MDVELQKITIADLARDYRDNDEEGVIGYSGELDIRPIYQREFVYGEKERNAVLASVRANLPLNVMYWAVRDDGIFEVIDGQQRTISICQYVNGDYSIDGLSFHNLQDDQKQQILDYKLMVYFCTGTASEKLEWFQTINIAGKEHTKQEIRNAVYAGPWTTDAKRYFSKTGGPAYAIAKDYMSGAPIRQDYLETAIKWISEDNIENYMDSHMTDSNANELWLYFRSVIDWIEATFPAKRAKLMKGVDWGGLHRDFKDEALDPAALEEEISELLQDEDVTNHKGVYQYVLRRDEKYLNIRAFTDPQKRRAYETQGGNCAHCGQDFDIGELEGDHKTPWVKGGKSIQENLEMLCGDCHDVKTRKQLTASKKI